MVFKMQGKRGILSSLIVQCCWLYFPPSSFFLLLRVSVIFIHFNSRCEIVGCHLSFFSAAGQNYKWVDINCSPEFSAVLVDGIENVLIWEMKCLPLKLLLDFSWLHLAGIFFLMLCCFLYSFSGISSSLYFILLSLFSLMLNFLYLFFSLPSIFGMIKS